MFFNVALCKNMKIFFRSFVACLILLCILAETKRSKIMKTTEIKIENLERTSKNWNNRTKEIILHIKGGGNMFGGEAECLHLTLHGVNSTKETGLITINGIIKISYNISRGANGPTSQTVNYFKGSEIEENQDPLLSVKISGSCGGGLEAVSHILSAEVDFLINN